MGSHQNNGQGNGGGEVPGRKGAEVINLAARRKGPQLVQPTETQVAPPTPAQPMAPKSAPMAEGPAAAGIRVVPESWRRLVPREAQGNMGLERTGFVASANRGEKGALADTVQVVKLGREESSRRHDDGDPSDVWYFGDANAPQARLRQVGAVGQPASRLDPIRWQLDQAIPYLNAYRLQADIGPYADAEFDVGGGRMVAAVAQFANILMEAVPPAVRCSRKPGVPMETQLPDLDVIVQALHGFEFRQDRTTRFEGQDRLHVAGDILNPNWMCGHGVHGGPVIDIADEFQAVVAVVAALNAIGYTAYPAYGTCAAKRGSDVEVSSGWLVAVIDSTGRGIPSARADASGNKYSMALFNPLEPTMPTTGAVHILSDTAAAGGIYAMRALRRTLELGAAIAECTAGTADEITARRNDIARDLAEANIRWPFSVLTHSILPNVVGRIIMGGWVDLGTATAEARARETFKDPAIASKYAEQFRDLVGALLLNDTTPFEDSFWRAVHGWALKELAEPGSLAPSWRDRFLPGHMRAAKEEARAVMAVAVQAGTFAEKTVDAITNELNNTIRVANGKARASEGQEEKDQRLLDAVQRWCQEVRETVLTGPLPDGREIADAITAGANLNARHAENGETAVDMLTALRQQLLSLGVGGNSQMLRLEAAITKIGALIDAFEGK